MWGLLAPAIPHTLKILCGLSSRSVEIFNFGYMGRSNPWTKCGVWGDMVDVITCAIFGDCWLRGVGVVRGVSLPSPIDLMRRT